MYMTFPEMKAYVEEAKRTPGNIRVVNDYPHDDDRDHIYRVSLDKGETVIGFYGHRGTPLPLTFVPHNHPCQFFSQVLAGGIHHTFYAVEMGSDYEVYRLNAETQLFHPERRRVNLYIVGVRSDTEGVQYSMPPETIHNAKVNEPTITVIRRSHPQDLEFAYLPVGTSPDEVRRRLNWGEEDGKRKAIPRYGEKLAYHHVDQCIAMCEANLEW